MDYAQIIVIALFVEAIWETLKMIWQNGKICFDKVGALVVGILMCLFAEIDIFKLVGIEIAVPIIGNVFTGILASRGSNFIHDIFSKVQAKG